MPPISPFCSAGRAGGHQGDALSVDNPLYEEHKNEGTNPLYEARSFLFNPRQILAGHESVRMELEFNFSSDQLAKLPPLPAGSWLFSIQLFDENGEPLTTFADPIDICFDIPDLTDAMVSKGALGYFNETTTKWEVEDEALRKFDGKYLCGSTTHLTLFSIGPDPSAIPEPGALLGGLTLLGGLLTTRRRAAR